MTAKENKTSAKKTDERIQKKTKATGHDKEIAKLKSKIKECDEQLAEMKDKYIRLVAEFDNYRKRTQKDMGEIIEYAGEKVLREILPVLDDFERALNSHGENEKSADSLQQGLGMIYKKFIKTLTDLDVRAIESLNKPFDPDLHHAVMAKEVEGVEPDIVVEEFEKGYMYKNHVLRHSKVVVSK
ncbi:MAG: nucleotide exchange factor GrpE [Fidelibacterota bacterium]